MVVRAGDGNQSTRERTVITMRLRSGGLGKTELEADIVAIKKIDDLVLFFVNTTKPVKWRTRMGFQEQDLRDLILALMKPKNMRFVISALLFPNKKVARTEDFWVEVKTK